jgi:hypothetical protein
MRAWALWLSLASLAWQTPAHAQQAAQPATAAAEPAKPDPAIEEGRRALGGGGFNWYDYSKDDLRRINVQPPYDPGSSNINPNTTAPNWSWWDWNPFTLGTGEFLLWIVLAVVVGGLAYVLIMAYLQREKSEATITQESISEESVEVVRTEDLPVAVPTTGDLLSAARRAFEAGNYRDAIIFLYSHQLVQLDRRQIIRLSKGKTNRQYLREVGKTGRSGLKQVFERTLVVFEDVYFGGHSLDRPRFEACWNNQAEFERLLQEAA